jgi:hypothetical protein
MRSVSSACGRCWSASTSLRSEGPVRRNAVRAALVVHTSDTLAAFAAGREGVPARHTHLLQAISGLNTVLAILAQPGRERA